MSDENLGYLGGAVSEPTSYTPVPKQKFVAVIAKAEFVDPVAMGWEPPEDASEEDKEEFRRPFPRLRWQIESTPTGEYTEYAGRMVDQRLSLRSGVNPKTGRSYAEGRADLIRLKHGLNAKDEVVGFKLFEDGDLAGLPREEAIMLASKRMAETYEGLRGTVQVIHIKNKTTGDVRDSVGKIVLPKG